MIFQWQRKVKQDSEFGVFPFTVLFLVKVEKNWQIWIHLISKIHLYDYMYIVFNCTLEITGHEGYMYLPV